MVEIIVRRKLKARGVGGRPRKPATHSHTDTIQGRVTPPEADVFQRVLAARRARGLPGWKNTTEWVRQMLHADALALGVELPAGYAEVRLVRATNTQDGPFAVGGAVVRCQADPTCQGEAGECGPICDAHLDDLLRMGPGAGMSGPARTVDDVTPMTTVTL